MRIVSYNIRNVRAPDRASWWWCRRGRLAGVLRSLDADLIAMQEAYRRQTRWLGSHVLPADEWGVVGDGRSARRAGEAVPLWHRRNALRAVADRTRWFGAAPDTPGSRFEGARYPRIATVAEYMRTADDARVVVANVHLDTSSVANRSRSLEQIVEWIGPDDPGRSTVVLGDFNAEMDEAGFGVLAAAGLRSALPPDAGPTSNGFGRDLASQRQIDHVFVSADVVVDHAEIRTGAGFASDHYPVIVDLTF